MHEMGLADIVFVLCIVAGLVGIYINRPTKRIWDDDALDKVYGKTSMDSPDHPVL
ncbi:MAG: hypothetical protein JEZ02_11950 [Desulfatibacillum sp.]|nr:hypothetical protein [Desulfatibacillum sp.]